MMSLPDYIIDEICKKYNITSDDLIPVDSYFSDDFEYTQNNQRRVLKIINAKQINTDYLKSEVEYLNHLKTNGLSVSYLLKSADANYIECIGVSKEESLYAVSYNKAEGFSALQMYEHPINFPESFLEIWGSYLGKLHRLSKTFVPSESFNRPDWLDIIDFFDLSEYPESQEKVVLQYKKTVDKINRLSKSEHTFGFTHNDLHDGNFLIKDNNITAFNFGDFSLNFFANDIALSFFCLICYAIQAEDQRKEYCDFFLTHFLKGYRKENNINSQLLESIPFFLKLRELDNYFMFYEDPELLNDPGFAAFMKNRQERIENDIPVIEFDFSKY